ncbi:MAG TPA: epoxyqueuosine reductase QueH [Clostridia bacterium]|nr:epoxyqueuosine reductase QueH [Clostridia bacterium]
MKLLLHICCGPCSTYPASVLQDENIEIEGFFFNPNIHPKEEFLRRKENVEKFSAIKGIPVTYEDDFRQDVWEEFKGAGEERCNMCYSIRLERAAAKAKEKGFDAFTTTLLVSPYQKHELIKELGEKFAEKYGVDFYYKDFRPGFRQGQQMAKEMELYRQKFCGCIVSFNESQQKKK